MDNNVCFKCLNILEDGKNKSHTINTDKEGVYEVDFSYEQEALLLSLISGYMQIKNVSFEDLYENLCDTYDEALNKSTNYSVSIDFTDKEVEKIVTQTGRNINVKGQSVDEWLKWSDKRYNRTFNVDLDLLNEVGIRKELREMLLYFYNTNIKDVEKFLDMMVTAEHITQRQKKVICLILNI